MIGIRLSEREDKILDDYAAQEQRSKTEIVREFVRSLEAKLKPRENEPK